MNLEVSTASDAVIAEPSSQHTPVIVPATTVDDLLVQHSPSPKGRKAPSKVPKRVATRKVISKMPSMTNTITTKRSRPGKELTGFKEYIRQCDEKISMFTEDIRQVEALAKTGDDRENKNAIRRIKFSDEVKAYRFVVVKNGKIETLGL